MWLRGLPARLVRPSCAAHAEAGHRRGHAALPGWTFLGQRPNRELAFGAVGRFWQPAIEWRDVSVADFRAFDEPGWGKIASELLASDRTAPAATLLTYECSHLDNRSLLTSGDSCAIGI